jgi:hypothetical protein
MVEGLGRNGRNPEKALIRQDGSRGCGRPQWRPAGRATASVDDLRDRLLAARALENVRCLEEA